VVSEPVQVAAVVRDRGRARGRLADILDDPWLEIVEHDLGSFSPPAYGSVDYVVHAASQARPKLFSADPVGTFLPNVIGTAALLTAFGGERLRGFLFLSSGTVYGDVHPEAGLVGELDYGVLDPLRSDCLYGEAKRAGEAICAAWARQHGARCMMARLGHTYGPGIEPDDGRVFADFAFNVIRGEDIAMLSDGSAYRPYCYATDAAAGLFAVLLDGTSGEAYNVVNSEAEMSVLEFAELLVGLYPERDLRVVRTASDAGDTFKLNAGRRVLVDTSKLAALGWSARVAPAEGFRRMIDAYALP
jgi:dTDP-glucose 4,6-dehydratase